MLLFKIKKDYLYYSLHYKSIEEYLYKYGKMKIDYVKLSHIFK